MNKLLCIVGPTGTGKTKRAIEESSKQPSILISADSRQVYRNMDIVTGKDHPGDIKIYGIDIVSPNESCSVAVWYDAVMSHITAAWEEGKLPIIVGGTGLYVKAITEGIETMQVPVDDSVRTTLSSLSIRELQHKLKESDPSKLAAMNHSDSLNPRRLARAIEISMFRTSHPERASASRMGHHQPTIIGLKYFDDSNYRSKVTQRVLQRVELGAIEETKNLLTKFDKNIQSMSAIGYKSIIGYLEDRLTKDEMVEEWVAGELAYAKRQMTWFRKQPVIWYDIDTYGNSKD